MTFVAPLFAGFGAAFLPCIIRPAAFVRFQTARRDRRRPSSTAIAQKPRVLQQNFQNLRQRQESAQIKAMKYSAPTPRAAHLTQVAALPMKIDDAGIVRVLLLTSRQTRRWVIPKGWPMKGRTPWQAAARETEEEAGLVGRPQKTPIGSYSYFKRRADHFDVCQVDVYVLEVEKKLKHWREKGQREARWVTIEEAASLVQEPGLIAIFRRLLSDQTDGSSGRVKAGPITTRLDRVNPNA